MSYFDEHKCSDEDLLQDAIDSTNYDTTFHKLVIKVIIKDETLKQKIIFSIDQNAVFQFTTKSNFDGDSTLTISIIDDYDSQRLFFRDILNLSKILYTQIKKNELESLLDPFIIFDDDESLGILDLRILYNISKLRREEQLKHPSYTTVEEVVNKWYNHLNK